MPPPPAPPTPPTPTPAPAALPDGVIPVHATVGGTRLKARFAVEANGVSAFLGWHDTKLELDCSFQELGDGQLRCLPYLYSGVPVINEVFADTGCTQRIAEIVPDASWYEGCAIPRFARARPAPKGATPEPLRLFRVGARTGNAPAFT